LELVKVSDLPSSDTWPLAVVQAHPPDKFSGVLSYSYLCGAASTPQMRLIEIPEDRLRPLIQVVLSLVDVDEAWYLKTNPDVDHAVRTGLLSSARAHYIEAGFFEDRWPFPIEVDEFWYQNEYPDVKSAIARGNVESSQDHFNRYGFLEGRLPSLGWSLLSRRAADE
jgi:hypothetical protein